MLIAIYILAVFFAISPFFPATGNPHWFFRMADFVRLQSLGVQLILAVSIIMLVEIFSVLDIVLLLALAVSFIYQFRKVYPYSILYPDKKSPSKSDGSFSIFAANVLQTNTEYDSFLKEVKRFNPDVVLMMETNMDWEKGVAVLEENYTNSVKIPLDNFYGMHLFSKKPFEKVETMYQVEEEVPSIFCTLKINGNPVQLICLHPAPPSPTENETSKERDAELLITGKKIKKTDIPVVVCGDMNDVVWSRVTRLLKKMTGMVDPRVGRGFFPTYHAGYWFMRFPLDHLFHTQDLFVKKMERSSNFGSDHFGMYYEIHLKKKGKTVTPQLDSEEKETVKELIERAEV